MRLIVVAMGVLIAVALSEVLNPQAGRVFRATQTLIVVAAVIALVRYLKKGR